ncbi:MAG: 30S ribosomal protein S8 [Planctomycetes bacterium]|nr:30S ribosomal protein S8 [Planctomycetota bacterium]
MSTDPVADMLTMIRNARMRGTEKVNMPVSSIKLEIARVLKEEGYIKDYKTVKAEDKKNNTLAVYLKYGEDGECIINKIVRISKPGRRVYCRVKNMSKILDGLGVSILSTPKGVMSDKECRKLNLGGEIICNVY